MKNRQIKILFALPLLVLVGMLVISVLTESVVRTKYLRSTATPKPIVDKLLACREIVLTVMEGDTLDSISLNYALSKDYIKQYNRMDTDELSPGMTLLIPMCNNMSTPTLISTK